MHPPRILPPRSRQQGATLLLLALILLIGGMTFFFSRVGDNPSVGRDKISQDALEQARQALIGYAATYRDTHVGEMFGYLPCPDTNNDGAAEAACGNAGEVVVGRLPYKTLGMPPLLDANGECLWYAVGNFKNNPKNSTLAIPEAMNWDTPGHFIVRDLDNKDLATPLQADGGAAAIVFSPGAPLAGQARPASIAGNPCSGDATNSVASYLDGGYVTPAATSLAGPTYLITAGRSNSTVNNDRVVWVTPGEIHSRRVKLRQDFHTGTNAMLSGVQACLQSAFVAPTPIDTVPTSNANAGRVPGACLPLADDGSYDWNYRENLFYAKCPVAGSRCMTLNGATCDGVLLFSGERTAGQNRVSDTDKRTIANYLEGANAAPFAPGGGSPAGSLFVGNSAFGATLPTPASTDVALCLTQNLSFASDIDRLEITSPTVSSRQFATVNTATKTLTLGDATTTAAPGTLGSESLYGCSWFPDSRTFGNGVRVHFIADFQQIGEGIAFVLADAFTNPDTFRCGAAGQSLGYSGKGAGAGNPIRTPKIALEFDTRANVGYDESLTEPLTGRKDDLMTASPHTAFVYWGNSLANAGQSVAQPSWDDNVHGKGGALSAAGKIEPANPTAAATHKKMKGAGAGGKDKYAVRLDIKRTRDITDPANKKSVYVLQGWAFALAGEACYATSIGAGIADLSDDFENLIFWSAGCKTPFTDTITIYDEDSNEAFKNFRVGFSTGQSSSGQTVVISNFVLGARP